MVPRTKERIDLILVGIWFKMANWPQRVYKTTSWAISLDWIGCVGRLYLGLQHILRIYSQVSLINDFGGPKTKICALKRPLNRYRETEDISQNILQVKALF